MDTHPHSHPQGPYGEHPYPNPHGGPIDAPAPATETSNSVLVFVLGLLGIVMMILFAPFAWWLGNRERRTLEQQGYREGPLLKAGRILGMIGSILLIASVLIGLVILVGLAMSGAL